MGEQIRAVVKPELLVWARTSARYRVHEAAKKAGVSAERLAEWESGGSAPTINQLRTLANIYKRPLAVFFCRSLPGSLMRCAISAACQTPETRSTRLN